MRSDHKTFSVRIKHGLITAFIIGIAGLCTYLHQSEKIAKHLKFSHIPLSTYNITADHLNTSKISDNRNSTLYVTKSTLRRIGVNTNRYYREVDERFLVGENQKLTVLLWSKSGDLVDVNQKCGADCQCNYTNWTNRNLADNADFIVIKLKTLYSNIRSYKEMFPGGRSKHKLVLLHRESPAHTNANIMHINGFFNFTVHYSYKADGVFAYGECVKRQHPRIVTGRNHAEKKTKLVMWMVSNCETDSHRERYVHKLKKYIKIDIYGSCGSLSFPNCHKKGSTVPLDDCFNADQKLIDKYKFYLAFENSICDDYISEKAFRAARGERNPLPIMLGGGSYHKHFPQGSYLDVKNFSSPKALAQYLHFLDKNDDEYNKHFQWKRDYTCEWVSYYGALCKTLFQLRNKKNVVTNAGDVFDQQQCISSTNYLKKNLR